MQYFPLNVRKSVTNPVVTKLDTGVQVVQAYNTDQSTGLTAVRGKSLRSAKHNAKQLGLM